MRVFQTPLIFIFFYLFFSLICSTGCSTGIERTKPITLSRNDIKLLKPSAETILMDSISAIPLGKWEVGRKFLVADDKVALVFLPGEYVPHKNMILEFSGIELKNNPAGEKEVVVVLRSGKEEYRYDSGMTSEKALASLSAIPMLIDLDTVEQASRLLCGRSVWTRSRLWYDMEGNKIAGKKYVPVSILAIQPGDIVFPLKVLISDSDGKEFYFLMNTNDDGVESRSFANIFSLSDPREQYKSISPENWALICAGKIRTGMTKDECKLSLGNPSEVDSGHDWSQTIDFWKYSDGTFLRFQDGLLIDYRK